MKESTLLKIAILGAILGSLVLFALGQLLTIDQSTIPQLKDDGQVRLEGTIGRVRVTNASTQFTLLQSNSIAVVIFDPVNLRRGDSVEITGRVETKNGKKQIIATEVKSLD